MSVSSSLVVGLATGPARAADLVSTTATQQAGRPAPAVSTAPAVSAVSLSAYESIAELAASTSASRPAKQTARPTVRTKSAPKKAVHKAVHKKAKRAAGKAKKVAHRVAHRTASRITFGTRVIREAALYRGTPYRYGATGPSRFDCSGFTRFIFAKFGISLPHSSSAQYSMVEHIPSSQKRIGDLVFFHSGSGHVYHVGIYAGGDEIWAATHTGDFVRLEGMWNASYYVGRIT